MARVAHGQRHGGGRMQSGHQSAKEPASDAQTPPASLEAVHELLFGEQSRGLERAIQALDERRRADLSTLRSELDAQLALLREHTRSTFQTHEQRVSAERQERANGFESLRSELRASARALEQRMAKLEESSVAAQAELRSRLYEQGRSFMEELRSYREDIAASVALEIEGLRLAKADRSTLARLLTEVAERLQQPSSKDDDAGVGLH